MTDQKIYRKFIKYYDLPVWEFTESEHLMPMVASFLSPEEADFLTGFPKRPTKLEEIAEMKGMDVVEMKRKKYEFL